MPAKVILLGVGLVVAVGIVVYDQREPIIEFADQSRRKLAHLLRRVADNINPPARQLAAPLQAADPFADPPAAHSTAVDDVPLLRLRRADRKSVV